MPWEVIWTNWESLGINQRENLPLKSTNVLSALYYKSHLWINWLESGNSGLFFWKSSSNKLDCSAYLKTNGNLANWSYLYDVKRECGVFGQHWWSNFIFYSTATFPNLIICPILALIKKIFYPFIFRKKYIPNSLIFFPDKKGVDRQE